MNILCLSDLHGRLPKDLPESDVLVIAGDVCPDLSSHAALNVELQRNWLLNTFAPWIRDLKRRVVMTWGNHDWVGQFDRDIEEALLKEVDDRYSFDILVDAEAHLQDTDTDRMIRFYGTPWTPRYGYWAFMESDNDLKVRFANIPKGLDVLISHGPPYAHCDRTLDSRYVGSRSLAEQVKQARPSFVVCGHIHAGRGAARLNGWTTVFNVAYLSEEYRPYTNLTLGDYEPRYRMIQI